MKFLNVILATAIFSLVLHSNALAESESTDTKKSDAKQFEIIDGTAPITGEPGNDSKLARVQWSKACDAWKAETKELNKSNQVMSMVCGSADCAYQENGSYVCSSTAVYKLKTEGVKAPPVPEPVVAQAQSFVSVSPPPTIFEVTPAPQIGFIWAPGYWGWQGHRHSWYPGHWINDRPGYVWIGHQWMHSGGGWRFEGGHWGQHH